MQCKHVEYGWEKPVTFAHEYIVPVIIKIIRNLGISPDLKILDTGCGRGYIMSELYKEGFKNIWGFDASESGIRIPKENFLNIT